MRVWAIILALASLASCGSGTPEIGRGLPSDYREAEPIFDARVKQRFPVGTPVQDVVPELEAQGFLLSGPFDGVDSATFKSGNLVMATIWSVRWRATNGQIDEIWGVHGAIAP